MELLSAQEAADRLGVHRSRVYSLIHAGRLPAARVGRTWIIYAADLEAVRVRANGYHRKEWLPPEARGAWLAVPEAAQRLGCSRAFVYDLIKRGHLEAQPIGHRRFIARASLERYLAKRGGSTKTP